MVQCLICLRAFKKSFFLSKHITKEHNITTNKYYDDHLLQETEGICLTCGNKTQFICLTVGYKKHCSRSCTASNPTIQEKRKKKLKKHYADGSIQRKRKNTCLYRYGKENPSQIAEIKEKKKNTFQKSLGVDNCFQSEIIKEKIRKTNRKKYGVDFSGSAKQVKEKKKETCQKKYGVDHYSKTARYKEQIRITCQDRYGVNNVFQTEKTKEKTKLKCRKKYGVDYYSQAPEIQHKSRETCTKKYGVDNFSKTFDFRLAARNRLIERIERNHGSINPRIGNHELEFFDLLQSKISYPIIQNKYLIGYYPDGRIEELRIIIEFDEPEHQQRTWYKNRDLQKDSDYKAIGYIVIRIKEVDFLRDKTGTINKLKEKLNVCSN